MTAHLSGDDRPVQRRPARRALAHQPWLGMGGSLHSAFWLGVGALAWGFVWMFAVPGRETDEARR